MKNKYKSFCKNIGEKLILSKDCTPAGLEEPSSCKIIKCIIERKATNNPAIK
jgi:hypothetical protein